MISGKFGVEQSILTRLLSRHLLQDALKTTMLSCYSRSRKSNHNIIGINKEPGQNANESYCFEENLKTQEPNH